MVGKSLKGADVVGGLKRILLIKNIHNKRIHCDNGSEFISKEVDRWAYENKVILDCPRTGTPADNPYIESFNGKFRDECFSVNWFLFLEDTEEKIEKWKWDSHFHFS